MVKLKPRLINKSLVLLTACFCLLSGKISAQTISVSAPSDSLTVGEVFNFSITIKNSTAAEKVVFPDSNSFGGDLEFLSSRHFKVSSSTDSTEYDLQFFAVEDVTIPPLPVKIVSNGDTNLVFTDPHILLYKQTISSEEDEFKPLKPNFTFPYAIWPYIVGLLLLLAAGFFIWWKYFRNRTTEEIQPKAVPEFKNPVNELESRLISIKETHSDQVEKDYKWFYSELGDALRWYVEELYKIPALESTTREVLRYMDAFGVDVQMVKHSRIVLNEADMTKFAKFKPTLDQSWKAYNEGLLFLERAKIVDSARIQRIKNEFEAQFKNDQEDEHGMG